MKKENRLELETIEAEMLNRAREIWQLPSEISSDEMDPLVRMLIGACAVGIQNINQEIESSRQRILERLAGIMLPEVLTGPLPASTILQFQPTDARTIVSPALQASGMLGDQEVMFSPSGSYRIWNAAVKVMWLHLGDTLLDITDRVQPQAIHPENYEFEITQSRTLFLGLEMAEPIQENDFLSFYFDWINLPAFQRDAYCRLLTSTRWMVNGKPIRIRKGIQPLAVPEKKTPESSFQHLTHFSSVLEKQVNARYEKHFVSLPLASAVKGEPTFKYPEAIASLLTSQEIITDKPLMWIEVQFPAAYPNIALKEQLTHCCLLNCIPAINRRLETKKHFIWDVNMNVVSLETRDEFLAMHAVYDGLERPYIDVQSLSDPEKAAGTYYLRHGGVSRIDTRGAKELLMQLMQSLSEERASFMAFSPDELVTDLQHLQRIIAKMKKNLTQIHSCQDASWHVVLKPDRNQEYSEGDYSIHYWSTLGEKANNLPVGIINTITHVDTGPAIKEVCNIISSKGGRNSLNQREKVGAYRNQLLNENRVVTKEDIKSFCRNQLGEQLAAVRIQDGVMIGETPSNGLLRAVEVYLKPSAGCKLTRDEWSQVCINLQTTLEQYWVGSIPIVVKVDKGGRDS